eukprot:7282311-Alexandrium_andersonii.AAC.1
MDCAFLAKQLHSEFRPAKLRDVRRASFALVLVLANQGPQGVRRCSNHLHQGRVGGYPERAR